MKSIAAAAMTAVVMGEMFYSGTSKTKWVTADKLDEELAKNPQAKVGLGTDMGGALDTSLAGKPVNSFGSSFGQARSFEAPQPSWSSASFMPQPAQPNFGQSQVQSFQGQSFMPQPAQPSFGGQNFPGLKGLDFSSPQVSSPQYFGDASFSPSATIGAPAQGQTFDFSSFGAPAATSPSVPQFTFPGSSSFSGSWPGADKVPSWATPSIPSWTPPAGNTEPSWTPAASQPSWSPPATSSQPSWAPPSQPSWAPPSQPSWASPSQPSWASPSQPSWAPPSQPSWAPPAKSSEPSWAPPSQPSWAPPATSGQSWAPPAAPATPAASSQPSWMNSQVSFPGATSSFTSSFPPASASSSVPSWAQGQSQQFSFPANGVPFSSPQFSTTTVTGAGQGQFNFPN